MTALHFGLDDVDVEGRAALPGELVRACISSGVQRCGAEGASMKRMRPARPSKAGASLLGEGDIIRRAGQRQFRHLGLQVGGNVFTRKGNGVEEVLVDHVA